MKTDRSEAQGRVLDQFVLHETLFYREYKGSEKKSKFKSSLDYEEGVDLKKTLLTNTTNLTSRK